MEQTIELLKRWVELEPERCREKAGGSGIGFAFPNWEEGYEASSEIDDPDMLDFNLGIVQRQVQKAIASHKLLFELANDRHGTHHAQVLDPSTLLSAVGSDPEPALALLKAYLVYLGKAGAKAGRDVA